SRQVWYLFATSAVVDHPYSGWWSRVVAGPRTILAGNDSTDGNPAPRSWSELRHRCLYQRISRVLPRTSYRLRLGVRTRILGDGMRLVDLNDIRDNCDSARHDAATPRMDDSQLCRHVRICHFPCTGYDFRSRASGKARGTDDGGKLACMVRATADYRI